MALFKVSGPPEDVARLRFLSANVDMVKHVIGKMRAQKLPAKDHVIVLVALTSDNALGLTFMRQYVDPNHSKMGGEAYACNITRDDLRRFLELNVPASVALADDDVPADMHRAILVGGNGVTKLDATFAPARA